MSIDGEQHELYGFLGGEVFYRIEIPRSLWDRVVSFSKVSDAEVPNWIDLGTANAVVNGEATRRVIATDNPKWFTTTYEKMMGPNAEY
jgi:hypothetical protein